MLLVNLVVDKIIGNLFPLRLLQTTLNTSIIKDDDDDDDDEVSCWKLGTLLLDVEGRYLRILLGIMRK